LEKIGFPLEVLNCISMDLVAHEFAMAPGDLSGHYALNLPVLAGEGDETRFAERLQKRLSVIMELESLRRKHLESRPFLNDFDFSSARASVNLSGLVQSQRLLLGDAPKDFLPGAERVCRDVRKTLDADVWLVEISDRLENGSWENAATSGELPKISRVFQSTVARDKKELWAKMDEGFERIAWRPLSSESPVTAK
jgi:hypothetical protein